jgi:hypothetical protein
VCVFCDDSRTHLVCFLLSVCSQSSASISSDLSFFSTLAPSLSWHSTVLAYTHAVEVSGDADGTASASSAVAAPMSLSDGEEAAARDSAPAPPSPPAVTLERAWEARLQRDEQSDSSEDEEEEDDDAQTAPSSDRAVPRAHARPFFGALTQAACGRSSCLVTPLPNGRFFHRCAEERSSSQGRGDGGFADGSSTSDSSAALLVSAGLPCRGQLVWSVPSALLLRINGRTFVPSPFDRLGMMRDREEVQQEQAKRMDWMAQAQKQKHPDAAPSLRGPLMSDA